MKSKITSSKNFDRSKLLLFKFLAHQIHPFAYAVNTFLQPALDDCRALLHENPSDTFNMLLSLTQTFLRFAPDAQLIYDDMQRFAKKLKDTIDECFIWLDLESIEQSSQLIESIRHNLLTIIEQEYKDSKLYGNMYKNMSNKLTNLQKINSLPTELQALSLNNSCDTTVSIEVANSKDIEMKTNGCSDSSEHETTNSTSSIPSVSSMQNEKTSSTIVPPPPPVPYQLTENTIASSIGASVTTKIMHQMMNLTVCSTRPPSTSSSLAEYEIAHILPSSNKQAMGTIVTFPPREDSTTIESYDIHTPRSILFSDDVLDLPVNPTLTDQHSNYDDEWDGEKSRQYYLNPSFRDPIAASAEWRTVKAHLSIVTEQSHIENIISTKDSHVTADYIREFGYEQCTIRPHLLGNICMTYGTPQTGPQATCLPIGVGLSYDGSTLLSCDVHRSAQNVRLFDIETGQLKHTITSNQKMKFHRPSAVMSNARNDILIVERDYIYITKPDGRLIQKIGDPSVKQLYGIALFHDRYLLTIDSKATDSNTAEQSRLLLFDPNSGKLVLEQSIEVNQETEDTIKLRNIKYVKGKILSEKTSKPRFLAAHNDRIYIADLGRSLIYGTSIRNRFDCLTVFGGYGRGKGEMIDPSGLFIDSDGNVISADSKNDRIQIFDSDGEYKTALKLNERIKRPSGICRNLDGTTFYVSCYLAGCVRAFNISY